MLYVYRVLLTGIHLMRTGQVEANLLRLNEQAKLPYIDELVERKVTGGERSSLADADLSFHQREYERLRTDLERAFETSQLPEGTSAQAALNDSWYDCGWEGGEQPGWTALHLGRVGYISDGSPSFPIEIHPLELHAASSVVDEPHGIVVNEPEVRRLRVGHSKLGKPQIEFLAIAFGRHGRRYPRRTLSTPTASLARCPGVRTCPSMRAGSS